MGSRAGSKYAWFLRLALMAALAVLPRAVFTRQEVKPAPEQPYLPSPVRVEAGGRLDPVQFIGALTDEERRRVADEAKHKGFSQSVLIGTAACAQCHQDVVRQWATSAHRFSSFNNPFYEASIDDLRKEPQGNKRARWCASCHDPALLLTGDFDTQFDRNGVQAQAGLTCLSCHAIRGIAGRPGNGNYVAGRGLLGTGDPLLEPDGPSRVKEPAAVELHRRNVAAPAQKFAEFCGSCHKASLPAEVNNYRWFRAQNDYDPWHDSGVSGNASRTFYKADAPRRCQECHMPREAAVLGDLAAKDGLIRSHRFLGVNTALPAIRKDDDTVKRIEEFLSNKMGVDIFALRVGKEFDEYVPAPDNTRPVLRPGEEVGVDVVVRNRDVGHTFPGGTLDLNEGWLELTLLGPGGELLAVNGELAKDGKLDPEAHAYCALILDEKGKPIEKHNVAHSRTLVWRHVIPFGESEVVRYRLVIPARLAGKSVTIRGRLLWRKFNERFTRFAGEANVAGLPSGVPQLPVLELARSEVSLRVAGRASEATAADLSKLKESDWQRFNDYGIGTLLQRDFSTAEYAFSWVQRLAPDIPDGLLNYARTMIEKGATGDGLKALEQLKSSETIDTRVLWTLGQAYFTRRDYEAASRSFRDVLRYHPEDRRSWDMLARSFANLGNYGEALGPLNTLIGIDPANEWGHYIKARALQELGKTPEAEQSLGDYEKFREDYFAWNRRWKYRETSPYDHQEAYSIHWHRLRPTRR